MSYGYNNPYQPQYRPYTPAPQAWQPPVQQNWQQPATQQNWQQPEPTAQEPPLATEIREDPVVQAIRELTAEVLALRKAITAKKKKEADDE